MRVRRYAVNVVNLFEYHGPSTTTRKIYRVILEHNKRTRLDQTKKIYAVGTALEETPPVSDTVSTV